MYTLEESFDYFLKIGLTEEDVKFLYSRHPGNGVSFIYKICYQILGRTPDERLRVTLDLDGETYLKIKELIKTLNEFGLITNYAVIGNAAARLHGSRYSTNGMDFLFRKDPNVVDNLFRTLRKLQYSLTTEDEDKLRDYSFVYIKEPHEVGIRFSITGFDALDRVHKTYIDLEGVWVPTISIDDLILNKNMTGRVKDKLVVAELEVVKDLKSLKSKRILDQTPETQKPNERVLGELKGQLIVHDNFNDPLPEFESFQDEDTE